MERCGHRVLIVVLVAGFAGALPASVAVSVKAAQCAECAVQPASGRALIAKLERRSAPPGRRLQAAQQHAVVPSGNASAPHWGEMVAGVHVGLSLNRARVVEGEGVSVEVHRENVSAGKPLGEQGCGPVPLLEIQDAQHHVLMTKELYDKCLMIGGWRGARADEPDAVLPGKPRRSVHELSTASMLVPSATPTPFLDSGGPTIRRADLPGRGVYYLVAVWSPRLLIAPQELVTEPGVVPLDADLGAYRMGEVYATARSEPVRVEVVAPGDGLR